MKDAPLSSLGSCPFSLFPISLSGVGVEKEEGEIANRGASHHQIPTCLEGLIFIHQEKAEAEEGK